MAELVILQTPVALLLLAAALFICLFEKITRAGRGFLSLLSALLAIVGVALDILNGAGLREAAALLTVFLLLNMGVRE
jgi:hypothetical protein